MSGTLIQSPEKVPGSSTQMVFIHFSSDELSEMTSGTITKRMQRNSFIHIMLSILFCALLAMLRNFHDAVPRQEIHTTRSEEHTSELQSRFDIVFRLLLEKIQYYTLFYL